MVYAALIVLLLSVLSGCSNTIRSSLMSSNSVFLPPSSERSVYVETHNISENQRVALNDLGSRLAKKGYQVTANPAQAYYWLQVNVVYCHTAGNGVTVDQIAQSGYGSGIGRGGTALNNTKGLVGANGMPDMSGMMAMMQANMARAGIGGMSGMPGMGPPPEEGVLYLCVADVQVSEQEKSSQNGHQVRMVAGVLQKKLNVEDATPIIHDKLGTGIAGLF